MGGRSTILCIGKSHFREGSKMEAAFILLAGGLAIAAIIWAGKQ
jgi:hypothetical protein